MPYVMSLSPEPGLGPQQSTPSLTFEKPVPRPPKSHAREREIRTQNRRRHYIERNPDYLASTEHEFADPILYVKLVRQYQTPAEREAEGKRKGYSRVLEGDLLRGEARMAEISQTGGQSSGSPEPSSSGDMASLEADRAPPADQEEARERWHEFLTHRFVHGEDDDFDYDKVDYDEAHDVMERRDAEEAWFEDEEPDWVSDQEVGSPAQRQPAHGGETGVQDF